ncbi:gamma-F420-2:alpha-L-glutamate ligase [Virgibacillus subterraneus]|uniref:Gamma-F420-2:alpha-L-glutamate ligase n=1 Tax=Virgibacillus subterraneus TaxID=621109 RepID=A0A1H9DLL8_9BACI|nr:ATP-grasp domain-containing protein [Virgibacillus subterraneus]SEQ14364.1 gamma-F420-2:alpha-L-glutamate ligase [Virgibacillus subterraneus]
MNLTGWLIYSKQDSKQNKEYIKWFIDEAAMQGITLKLILREELTIGVFQNKQTVLCNNQEVQLPNFAVVRTIEPLLNKVLESMGINVFNSSRISTICNNKALTHYHMAKLNIPMVDTIFIKKKNCVQLPIIPFPFVVKGVNGRGGRQVHLIEDEQQWERCIADDISAPEFIIQSTKNVQLGKDVRVFVVGNQIVGSVMRESNSDFRSNYKLGGSAKWYSLDRHEITVLNKILDSFDFGMVGIDFLLDTNGKLLLNEIEDVVGSRTLSSVSDINILNKYITHIKESGNS